MSADVVTLPAGIDPVDAFSLFVINQGNVEKVALQLRADPQAVEEMSRTLGWPAKLVAFRSGSSGDEASGEVNRGVSFILGHRFRKVVEALVDELQDPDSLRHATTVIDRNGNARREYKGIRDLGAAIESACEISYRALGDLPGPTKRKTTDGRPTGDLVLDAMAAMDLADACPQKTSTALVRESMSPPK